jgi:hypothetical protein
MKAKAQFTLFAQQAVKTNEKQIAAKLVELFKKDERYDNIDTLSILK